jgi:hypothetical protein
MYPDESISYGNVPSASQSPYEQYLSYPTDPDPTFLVPSPREGRGKHNIHAFVSDGYFAGKEEFDLGGGKLYRREPYEGYHLEGYNVLYGDFHARRIVDPKGQIHAARLNPVRYSGTNTLNANRVFKVWDYFSRYP